MSLETRTVPRVAQSRPAVKTLRAIDLAPAAEHRGLWRARAALRAGQTPPVDFPGLGRGFALPMGFWLTDSDAQAGSCAAAFHIVFEPGAATAAIEPASPAAMECSGLIRR